MKEEQKQRFRGFASEHLDIAQRFRERGFDDLAKTYEHVAESYMKEVGEPVSSLTLAPSSLTLTPSNGPSTSKDR